MIFSKTYGIEDCWIYYTTEFSNTNFNNSVKSLNFTLPSSDFELIWEQSSNRSGSNNCYLRIGSDDNNCILMGVIDGNQSLGYYVRENGQYISQERGSVTGAVNTYQEHKLTSINGNITYNTSNLPSFTTNVNLSTIINQTVWYAKMKNIKIKPL